MFVNNRKSAVCWFALVASAATVTACSGHPEIIADPDGGWQTDGAPVEGDSAVPDGGNDSGDGGVIIPDDGGDQDTGNVDAGPCANVHCGEHQHCVESGVDGGAGCVFDTCADLQCKDTETCVEGQAGVSGAYCKDLSCTSDLQCDQSQYCNGTMCVDDVCEQDTSHCNGQDVVACAPNGGSEQTVFTCGSAAYFDSQCQQLTPNTAVCPALVSHQPSKNFEQTSGRWKAIGRVQAATIKPCEIDEVC